MNEDMKDELTSKMHEEFSVSKEIEEKHRAGCVWHICGADSSREEIERVAKTYSISYETAMRWRDHWLRLQEIDRQNGRGYRRKEQ